MLARKYESPLPNVPRLATRIEQATGLSFTRPVLPEKGTFEEQLNMQRPTRVGTRQSSANEMQKGTTDQRKHRCEGEGEELPTAASSCHISGLCVKKSRTKNAGNGLFSQEDLKQHTILGAKQFTQACMEQ